MTKQLFSKLNCFVRITARVIPCLLALFVAQFSVAQEVPTFTPIGNFNANSGAMFVSADGNMVTGLSANQTFRWSTSLTEMISLGRLAGSELPAIATSANSDGSVVVGISESWNEIPLQSTRKVVLWKPEQGWQDLGLPFESSENWDLNSEPRVSADGSVVLAISWSSIGNKLWRWTTAEGWSNLGQAPNQSAWISGSQRISDNGSVIIANAFNQAFRWTTSGWVGMGVPTASTSFYATCMSNDGSVVVGFIGGSNQQSERFVDLFRWTEGSLVNLGSPSFGTLNQEDLFVSGDGLIIAGSAIDSQSLPHIFRLALGSEFQDLAPLPENHTNAQVAAINQDGSVLVGLSQRTNFQTGIIETTQPFRWAAASGMSSLGQYPDTSTDALPKAMNNDGSVIVGVMGRQVQGLPEQFVDIRAFRWTGALGMTVIGTFQTAIHPEDLSHDGSILVGNAEFGSFIHSNEHLGFGDHAFRWSSALLQDLGVNTVQGEFNSHAEFVSGDGSTVVGTMKFDGGSSLDFSRAFRVTSSGVKVDLGTLRAAGGEFDSSSYIKSNFPLSSSGFEQESGKCVSRDGSVIVGTSESFVSDIPIRRAFRWTSSGMSNLGTLGVGESSAALALSSDGLTVVGASGNFQTYLTRAFRWTSGVGMVSLGTLNGTDSSAAFFTSSNGEVVVGTCTGFNGTNEVRKAFRWKDGEMTSLGSLPGGAQDLYWPVAINDDGSVVVGLSENTDAQGVTTRRAFRWTTVGGMSNLPAEITDLHGLSLSGNGSIVVGSRIDGEVGRVACLWTPGLGLVDLRMYLDGLGVANVGSLNLNNAAISQDSTSIAVTYQVEGRDAAGIVRGLQFVTSNDDCANALSIELGNVSFNTAGSTTDGNNPTAQYCASAEGTFFNDIWYSFTPSSTGTFSATTCNQANFDTRIDVLDGCGGTLLACNDDACDSLSTYVEFSGVAGQIYLIRLGAYSNSFGTGTLTLNQVVSPPTISSVSPSSGTTLGGTAIAITGTNLTGASSVTVGGVAATSVVVVSSTSITAVTPAGTEGAKDVAVTTAGGTVSLPSAFTFVVPTPTISGVSPSSGTTLGGTAITITGTDLTGASSVTVDGVAATSVNVVSSTSITAVTPAGSAGAKDVAVTTAGGTASLPSAFTFVVPTPTISGVSPSSGTTLGGTAITITGTNLTGASSVTVDGVAAISVNVVSSTSITAVTPAGTAGAKDIAVTTAGGTASLPSAFTFVVPTPTISGVSPSSGTTLGGTAITITGTNLTGATSLTVGGVAATSVNVVSSTSITAVTPAGSAGAKSVALTTLFGTASMNDAFTYRTPGSVVAWGYNQFDQCTIPLDAQSDVVSIACGVNHTMALKDGQVFAWGSNASNQCIVPVAAQSGVSAIACGGYFSIALKDGVVLAWGDNGSQQCNVPVAAQSGVTAIAGGQYHTTALKAGAVLGWGNNGDGRSTTPSAAQRGVSAIACGYYHTLALKDGQVLAWGENTEGQCNIPLAAQSGVTAIAGGMAHSIALKDGQVFAWGQGNAGQCTITTVGESGVTAIAGCAEATIALIRGQVFAWGSNGFGQCLGTDSNGNPILSGPTGQPVQVGGSVLNGVTNIAGGQFHASALKSGSGNEPGISSVSPSCGPQLGGTEITITGTNLTGATSVTVGGVPATNVVVVSETVVTAVTPSTSVIGTKNVSVSTNAGSAIQIDGFSYVTALSDFSNGGFEAYSISGSYELINGNALFSSAPAVYGWRTTASDNQMEIWTSGFLGVPSHSGNQFAELNANQVSQLFQEISGIGAGQNVAYSFAHRGRSGVEQMRFRLIDLGPDNASGGGNDTELENRVLSTGTTGWVVYTGSNTALGNLIQFRFESMGGGSSGNFLDSVQFGDLPSIESISPTSGTTLGGTAITITGAHFADASTVTVGEVPATSVIVVSETLIRAVTPAGTAGVSDVVVTTVGGTATGAFSYINIVAPTGVAASDGLFTNKISVSWNAVPNALGYELFRGATKIADIASGATVAYDDIDESLTPGTSFSYTVKALFTAGTSDESASDTGFVGFAIVAPTGVAASDGLFTNKISVSWNAVPNALGYELFRGATKIADIASGATVAYDDIDESLTPGTSFSYTVKALFTVGTSDESASDTGFVGFAIVAPTGVAASDGLFTNKISVSWNAVPNALGYELFRGATKIADIASGVTVSYDDIDESLTPGTSFSYTVKALFTAGTSDESASDTGFVGFAIVAPTGVAASDGLFTNKISVSWNVVPNALGYELFRGATKIADIASGATVSYDDIDESLTPGTSFTYSVKALFTAGTSDESASDTGFVGFAIVTPTGVAASDGLFTNKISVSWNAVPNALGYELFRGATKIADIASGATVSYNDIDESLTPGTSFSYTVKALFTAGISAPSASDTGFVGFAIVAPTGVAASDGLFTNKIAVSWIATANASGYQLFRGATKIADIASGATVSYNDVDGALTPGTSFTYTVKALFTAGVSSPSASDTGFVGFAIVAPTGVAASDGTITTGVNVTWIDQVGATGYEVFRSGTTAPIAVVGLVSSYTDTPPLSGKIYSYSIKAIFTAGTSTSSASNTGWQNLPAPLAVTATAGTFANKVVVAWLPVTGVTGYKIFRVGSETAIGSVGSSSLTFSDTTATPGTSYEYFVKATSTAGLSGMSASQSGYRNLPSPTGVAATDGTSVAFVGVTWVAAPGAVEYEIFRSGTADPIGTSSGTSFNDVGAVAGKLCTYTVKAKGTVGVSAASTGNTGFRALSAPTAVAASDGTSAASVTVTWVASTGATAYKIFRSGSVSAIGTVGAVTTFNDTSATVGVLYTYTVKAVVGTLGMSAASSGDTGYRNRPAPANVNATDTDTTKVRVTWSAVTGSTGYEVFRSIGGAPATLIASPTALLFNDTAIARGTTAVYSVRAKFVLTGSSPATTVTTLMSVPNSGTRP